MVVERAYYQAARRLMAIGLLMGVGVAGTLDEVILHQLLQWHNFYVHTTQYWRIFIDGLFHLFSSLMLSSSALLLFLHRRQLSALHNALALLAGVLMGAGSFNLYDGIVQHKLLNLHPVREGVENILPYDLVYNAIALLLLVAGVLLWRRVAQLAPQAQPAGQQTTGPSRYS